MTPRVHPVLSATLRDELAAGVPVGRDADWDAVVTQAEAEALAPLLRRQLRRHALLDDVPPSARARLERQALTHGARAVLLAHVQARVLAALAEAGVRVAPLRGPALGERLYGDATLRPCGDVDVLIDRTALPRVERALGALGFGEVDRRAGFAREFSYALEMVESGHGVVVEPHFALGYPPFTDAVDLERVWSRARRTQVAGIETLALGPEATLLNLCLHVIHKAPAVPLLWIYDLDRLVRLDGDALDWTELVELARASKLAPMVAATLRQAVSLFGAAVPEAILVDLERAPTSRLTRLLSGVSVDGKESLASLLTLPGVRPRLRYASAVLLPSPRFMAIEYGLTHRRQLGAAYTRRVGYFLWQAVKGIVRLCS